MSKLETFMSVWDALEDTPEALAEMRLRSELMIALQDAIESWCMPAAAAGRRLGLPKQRFDDLRRGRISRFSLENLVALADKAKLTIQIQRSAAE